MFDLVYLKNLKRLPFLAWGSSRQPNLKAIQRTAESFAVSNPLAPLSAACNILHTALSSSQDAAFNSAAVRSFAHLVASAAGYAGDESNLAHVEEHYESNGGDSGADDKCSPQEVALESLRRGLAYGVAHYRSAVVWNAYANYSMAEARRRLISIVGRSVDMNTPQVANAARRFMGLHWLSLAGEQEPKSSDYEGSSVNIRKP